MNATEAKHLADSYKEGTDYYHASKILNQVFVQIKSAALQGQYYIRQPFDHTHDCADDVKDLVLQHLELRGYTVITGDNRITIYWDK